MRPFETSEQREKRKRKNQLVLGLIVIALMVFSTAGYALWWRQPEGKRQRVEYKGYVFTQTENGWSTKLENGIVLITQHLPQELENVSTKGKPSINDFNGKVLYIAATSLTEKKAASVLANPLRYFVERAQLVCTAKEANESFCQELPIKSCKDADAEHALLIFDDSVNETSVNYEPGCLTIQGQDKELIKATEKALFMLFGIM